MRHRFHSEAVAEFDQAAAHYRRKKPGLELRFIDAIEETIHRICLTPERWRKLDGDIRRCFVRVFPYVVLYSIEPENFVYIVAVMHAHRAPGYWKSRLSS